MSGDQESVQGPRIRYPEIIIGLDPGKHLTGFAEAQFEPATHILKAARLENPVLWNRLRLLGRGSLVVCEGFRLYKWAAHDLVGSDFLEVRNIGRIEEIVESVGATLWLIPAAAHKKVISAEFLTKTGAWSRNNHVQDALTVMWYGILKW